MSKLKSLFILLEVGMFFSYCNATDSVTDIEGNEYATIKIGTQTWMAENLKTATYNDSTSIPNITDDEAWANLTTGAWCYHDNDSSNNAIYGKLYNWYTVNTGKMCPKGWHIPTDDEWKILIKYLGGWRVAGGKMKATTLWKSPNIEATNESGFSALPGSSRTSYEGIFYPTIGADGYWWSATEFDSSITNMAWFYELYYNYVDGRINKDFWGKRNGFSCRCVKDEEDNKEISKVEERKEEIVLQKKSPKKRMTTIYSSDNDSSITDIEGNKYAIVKIGTQTWMSENLKTATHNDGTPILNITNNEDWNDRWNVGVSAWCYYNNDSANNSIYGKLYNWYAVNTGKLCPQGWHIPTKDEWEILSNYLGGLEFAGSKMTATALPNIQATNESGFTALPGGMRNNSGAFMNIGEEGNWWSGSKLGGLIPLGYQLDYDNGLFSSVGLSNDIGLSCRCIKD